MAMMMTASFRGTPSFTPVPTQNTAPVHEFRALYTHDSHKKKKTWHDGSLRFHTFNRRVMLYDEGKNYIGDHHCRQDDDVDEGSELRLNKGVLVDVGERLGETQTDLTPLLDRRKDDASPQPARRIQLVASASQSTSKKLSDMLPSQPRMGRARPVVSPYEGRQALAPTQATEASMPPPAKRVKVSSSGKENRLAIPRPVPRAVERPAPKAVPQTEPPEPAPAQQAAVDFLEVLDLSSDEEIAKSAKGQAPKATKANKKAAQRKGKARNPAAEVTNKVHAKERQPMEQASRQPQSIQASEANMRERAELTTSKVVQNRTEITEEAVDLAVSRPQPESSRPAISQPSTFSKPGTTQLRFRSQKPKRKLMYRALLPSSKDSQTPLDVTPSRASMNRDSELSFDKKTHLSMKSAVSNQAPSMASTGRRRGSVDEPVEVPSSPLFVPQEGHVESPVRRSQSSQDGPEGRVLCSPEPPEPHSLTLKDGPEINSEQSSPSSQPILESAVAMPPPKLILSKPTRMLPPPLVALHSPQRSVQSTARSRPFRRVRSENDAYDGVEDDFPDLDLSALPPPSFLAKAQLSPVRAFKSLAKNPAKLRRTASDSALTEENQEPVTGYNIQPIQEVTGDIGPWTSSEAFLLFEWWPPGRTKPHYDTSSFAEVDVVQSLPRKATITTARDMLIRDELNVL